MNRTRSLGIAIILTSSIAIVTIILAQSNFFEKPQRAFLKPGTVKLGIPSRKVPLSSLTCGALGGFIENGGSSVQLDPTTGGIKPTPPPCEKHGAVSLGSVVGYACFCVCCRKLDGDSLFAAVHQADHAAIERILSSAQESTRTRVFSDALIYALVLGNTELQDKLVTLDHHIDQSHLIKDPLLYALMHERFDLIEQLREKGAKLDLTYENGQKLLASYIGNRAIMYLIEQGANPNERMSSDGDSTFLKLAARSDDIEFAEFLLKRNVGFNKDVEHSPLLKEAERNNNPEMVALLASYGAKSPKKTRRDVFTEYSREYAQHLWNPKARGKQLKFEEWEEQKRKNGRNKKNTDYWVLVELVKQHGRELGLKKWKAGEMVPYAPVTHSKPQK